MEIARRGSSPSQELFVLMQWMSPPLFTSISSKKTSTYLFQTSCCVVFGSTACPSFFAMLFSGYAGRQGLSGEGTDLAVHTGLLESQYFPFHSSSHKLSSFWRLLHSFPHLRWEGPRRGWEHECGTECGAHDSLCAVVLCLLHLHGWALHSWGVT